MSSETLHRFIMIKIDVFLYVNISCHDNQSKTVTENSQKECMACKILKRINTFCLQRLCIL